MRFEKRSTKGIIKGSIDLFFPEWEQDKENVVFVGPHDDDIALGSGLLVQAVQQFQGQVYFLIVTDGSNGYWDKKITRERKKESYESARKLSVESENIEWLNYVDGDLGKKFDSDFQKNITEYLRDVKATRIIVPTDNDEHPDHFYVNKGVRISRFHANGKIWKHCGDLVNIKTLLESAVYCGFKDAPDLALLATQEMFKRKLEAIACFKSQEQIASLVENVRHGGCGELFKTVHEPNYSFNKCYKRYFNNE